MFPSTNFKTCCKKWHFIQNNRNKINKTINRSHVRCLIQFNLKERKKGPYDTKNSNKRMKYRFWACWTDSSYCKFCGWIDWIIKLTCWCVCVRCAFMKWISNQSKEYIPYSFPGDFVERLRVFFFDRRHRFWYTLQTKSIYICVLINAATLKSTGKKTNQKEMATKVKRFVKVESILNAEQRIKYLKSIPCTKEFSKWRQWKYY